MIIQDYIFCERHNIIDVEHPPNRDGRISFIFRAACSMGMLFTEKPDINKKHSVDIFISMDATHEVNLTP